MGEILHHLGYIKPRKSWDKLPTSTGDRRISEPSTVRTAEAAIRSRHEVRNLSILWINGAKVNLKHDTKFPSTNTTTKTAGKKNNIGYKENI